MEKVKKILLILIVLVLIAAIVAVIVNFTLSKTDNKSNPVVTMEFEGYGIIKIELYPDMAPNTVKNFIRLAQRGFYNGKTITDIEDGIIRGGLTETTDDSGNTTNDGPKMSDIIDGGDDTQYSITGEFIENGYNDNTLSHQRGVISMYRKTYSQYQQELAMVQMMGYSDYTNTLVEQMYDSQSSGFFILTQDETDLDGTYAAFGKVIEGMDVVDAISNIELQTTTSDDGTETTTTKPVTEPVITSVSVETYGVDYGVPEVQTAFDFDTIFNMFMQSYMSSSSSTSSY